MVWEIETTDAFEAWWRGLTEQQQDDVTAIVELLGERGPHLPFPYTSGVEASKFDHMRELRVQSHGEPIRIFYAFDHRRVAVLLIGGNKTGNEKRFYKAHIRKADGLYEEHLESLKG